MKTDQETKVLSQKSRFIQAAKKAECDESETAFEEKLRKIARAKLSKSQNEKNKK